MNKNTRLIAWIFYSASILVLLFSFITGQTFDLTFVLIEASLMAVPWIICIVHFIKTKSEKNFLWLYFLVVAGTIAIPIYLYKSKK